MRLHYIWGHKGCYLVYKDHGTTKAKRNMQHATGLLKGTENEEENEDTRNDPLCADPFTPFVG